MYSLCYLRARALLHLPSQPSTLQCTCKQNYVRLFRFSVLTDFYGTGRLFTTLGKDCRVGFRWQCKVPHDLTLQAQSAEPVTQVQLCGMACHIQIRQMRVWVIQFRNQH